MPNPTRKDALASPNDQHRNLSPPYQLVSDASDKQPNYLVYAFRFGMPEKAKMLIEKGGRVRGITKISGASLDTVRKLLESGEELRHIDQFPGVFMLVGDNKESISSMNINAENLTLDDPTVAFWTDNSAQAEYLNSTFETVWNEAVDANKRINELLGQSSPQIQINSIKDCHKRDDSYGAEQFPGFVSGARRFIHCCDDLLISHWSNRVIIAPARLLAMTKAEDAVALFQQGFNCSQAILSVFAPEFGLDRDMARRISQGFGAGIARTDKICGSLSGAIMLIGLRYGSIRADDVAAKEETYAVVGEFLQEFKTHHGSVACTDLLGYNLSDPQQFAAAKTHKVAMERCPALIRDAVELVEKYCCNLGVPKL